MLHLDCKFAAKKSIRTFYKIINEHTILINKILVSSLSWIRISTNVIII